MTPFVFRVLHVSTWIHFGADRTPPFDISEKGVIRFCVSSNAFAVHCHFDVKYFLHSTTYFPLPPSHTTYSVGSTGLALWVYAVCGVWGGWVGSFRVGLRRSLRVCYDFRYT